MKLIDKDALVAEIEKRKKIVEKRLYINNSYSEKGNAAWERDKALYDAYNSSISFIDTLEVKEVDLNEEIEKCLKKHSMLAVGKKDFADIAKHFFELGLKQLSSDEYKIGESEIYLEDDGGEPPYDGKQWLDLSCTEYEIPSDMFKDGDNVEIIIRKTQKGE